MDVKNWLETYCDVKGWNFIHGRKHDQNLQDAVNWFNDSVEGFGNRDTFLFLDPYTTETNADGNDTFTGSLMIATPNDFDERDGDVFEKMIAPLKPQIKLMLQSMRCTYDVNRFTQVDVYNVQDLNVSGISVQFNLNAE
jgi:hypothetical protein